MKKLLIILALAGILAADCQQYRDNETHYANLAKVSSSTIDIVHYNTRANNQLIEYTRCLIDKQHVAVMNAISAIKVTNTPKQSIGTGY